MKINFVYHTPQMLGSGYMGSLGLYNALKSNDLLNYGFDTTPCKQELDLNKLRESPIFFVRGMLPGRMPLVARCDNQFKACWQSESYYTRHGGIDVSTSFLEDNQKHFQMLFVCSETDLNMYKIPTYWLPSWADTTVLDDYCEPEFDGLGFIGGHKGREDFLNGDVKGILNCKNTAPIDKSDDRAKEYGNLISKFKYLVSPPGRCFNGMCGRAFEIMACNRLCFQWLNEDTMFEHMKYFNDGVDIVYFHDWDELNEKFEYYKERPGLSAWIANNGYRKTREFHNQNIRVRYIVNCMYEEYKKWKAVQDLIPDLESVLCS